MNKKGQISLYIIIGLIIVLLIALFYFSFSDQDKLAEESRKVSTLSEMRIDMHAYIKTCIRDAVKEGMSRSGIREESKQEYEQIVKEEVITCTNSLFDILKTQGKDITTGEINTNIQINEETVIVKVDYPITIKTNSQKAKFQFFEETFDRTIIHKVPGGIALEDITIISNNRKAQIEIPKGAKITDEDGNPIEQVGIKVEDLHFDNLENNVVVGNIVYDGLPDGTYFSKPVQISLEYDETDFPDGLSKENLRVSWWDEDFGIWWALPTIIEKNRIIANISHFTVVASAGVFSESVPFDGESWVFRERFNDCNSGACSCSGSSFDIAEKQNKDYAIGFIEGKKYEDMSKQIMNSEEDDLSSFIIYGNGDSGVQCNIPSPDYKDDLGTLSLRDHLNYIPDDSWDKDNPCANEDEVREQKFSGLEEGTIFWENAERNWESSDFDMQRYCFGRPLGGPPNPDIEVNGCDLCVPIDFPITGNKELPQGGACTCISIDTYEKRSEENKQRGWKTNGCLSGQTIANPAIGLKNAKGIRLMMPFGKAPEGYNQNSVEKLILKPKGNAIIQSLHETITELGIDRNRKIVVVPSLVEESADCEITKFDDGQILHQIFHEEEGEQFPAFGINGVRCEDTIMTDEQKDAYLEKLSGGSGSVNRELIRARYRTIDKSEFYDACSKAGVEWFIIGQGVNAVI